MRLSDKPRVEAMLARRAEMGRLLRKYESNAAVVADSFLMERRPDLGEDEIAALAKIMATAARRELGLVEAGLTRLGVTLDLGANGAPAGGFPTRSSSDAPAAPILTDPEHIADVGVADDMPAALSSSPFAPVGRVSQ